MSATSENTKQRFNLTGWLFNHLAAMLNSSETGARVVSHVKGHLGIYYQVWSLAVTLLIVIIIRMTVITAFYIPSPSMLNTLKINDRVFVFRLQYLFTEPSLGDIVVFRVPETIENYDPDKPIWIKRIVGMPGDHVEIIDHHLVINGKRVVEPTFFRRNPYYDRLQNGDVFRGMTIPEGHVLVFGDNSANSYDSRYWGPIPQDRIIGKAVFRFWPMARFGAIYGESVSQMPAGW